MDYAVILQMENRVHKIEKGHYELASSMESISKDMHILSTTLVELKNVMKSLANREVDFQLFKQKTDQSLSTLGHRFDELKVLDKESTAKIETVINNHIEEEAEILKDEINTNFRYTLWMVGSMFSLFIAYVAYMDVKFTSLGDSTAKIEQTMISNDERLKGVQVQARDLYFDVKELRKNQETLTQQMIK